MKKILITAANGYVVFMVCDLFYGTEMLPNDSQTYCQSLRHCRKRKMYNGEAGEAE